MPRLLVLAAFMLAALVLTAPQSSAGPTDPFGVRAAKEKDGQYTTFLQALKVPVGEKKTVYWRIKSKVETDLSAKFDDAATPNPNPGGYKVRWYKGKKEVTTEVKGDGRPFTLPAGGAKTFRATVKHVEPSAGFCLGGQAQTAVPPASDGAYFAVGGDPCD
jgi:hypothetical protein